MRNSRWFSQMLGTARQNATRGNPGGVTSYDTVCSNRRRRFIRMQRARSPSTPNGTQRHPKAPMENANVDGGSPWPKNRSTSGTKFHVLPGTPPQGSQYWAVFMKFSPRCNATTIAIESLPPMPNSPSTRQATAPDD